MGVQDVQDHVPVQCDFEIFGQVQGVYKKRTQAVEDNRRSVLFIYEKIQSIPLGIIKVEIIQTTVDLNSNA